MPWADTAAFNFALLCTSLMAAVLACMLLSLEYFGNPLLARRAPGIFIVLLALAALAAWSLFGASAIAFGAIVLAGLLLVAWPVSFEGARRRMIWLLTPKFAWALVLGISLIASRYLAAHVLQSLDRQPALQSVDLEDLPVRTAQAFTDQGRAVPLFHFKIHSTDAEIQRFIDSHEKDRSQIIRLLEPNPAANCHGWVFTGGKYGIRDPEIPSVLHDNGYIDVSDPREGDLVIYAEGDRITHSGVVRIADKHAPVLVESKWGPLGVYLHAVDQQPFAGHSRFLRSPRADHLLALRRTGSATEPVAQLLNDATGAQ